MRKVWMLVFLLIIGLVSLGIAAEQDEGMARGSKEKGAGMHSVKLTGDEVVPPVKTDAKGEATLHMSKDGKKLEYTVTASDMENVTAAHIHTGKKGENGPPVAPLAVEKKGKASGTIAKGTLTANDLMGSLKGKTLHDLIMEIENGNAYVNVHTEKHPDGEVRGQLK
ncbi:MAG: CHRD domain-containing protein [Thermodesulfovibrionales bacterium]